MKILRVVGDLYPFVVGGLEIHAHEMSKYQAILGHEVTVYTSNLDRRPIHEFKDGYNIIRYNNIIKLMGNSICPNLFFKLFNDRYDFDIIHAHSHLFFSTNLCALVRKFGSSPLVVTNHGLNSQTSPEWFQNLYTSTGAKWTIKAADKIICYTEPEKQQLIDLGINPKNIAVIHNGIDTDLFVPGKKNFHNNMKLLWIGRFHRGKGVDYLVDAFKLLINKYPNLKLLMVGRGTDRERIKEKIKYLKMDKYIELIDFVPNADIVKLYQRSSVFILPSLEEGVPRTILEAMSCGIPVVCSNLPQLVNIVSDGGFLVPAQDSEMLADRVSEILSNKILAKKMGENGRENVIRNYSWKDTVEKTIELYKELI